MSLPFISQENVEGTREFSLPLQNLLPSRAYHFLPGSSDAGEVKNVYLSRGFTHTMWTFHWLSLKIPSSPLSSFFFFHHPTESFPACGEPHIHSQGSKLRTPRSPDTCVAPGSHNAHRGHLTCTNACDRGCVPAIVEKRKNEASLREVEAIP